MCLLPLRGVTWEEFANTNYRIWSVGLFLLKEGCFQVVCRDSCQNTVTVSETRNIATSLVTSVQVCRYMYLSTSYNVQSWHSYIIRQFSCVSLLTIALVFVLCPCCISCASIIVKFECVSIAAELLHVHVHCSVIVHTGSHLALSHISSFLHAPSLSLPPPPPPPPLFSF